jgi:membrane peptidoglycan carboxypeptidase
MAHGYSISVTPIQIVTMYASIINGGNLVKPFVVKKVFDNQGNIITENKPIVYRKVISEETSDIMRRLMEKVVEEGTGKKARLEFVSCGGKTGTAKKFIPGIGYSERTYISSFVGFFPVEKPEYLIFIKLDSPQNGYYGGEVAAPIFKRIGDRIWKTKHSIVNQNAIVKETKTVEKNSRQVPDLVGKSKVSAIEIAKTFCSKIELKGNGEIVREQIYDPFKHKITLIFDKSTNSTQTESKVKVPSVVGRSLRDASTILKSSGIKFVVEGKGYVKNQSIKEGDFIDQKTTLKLICE